MDAQGYSYTAVPTAEPGEDGVPWKPPASRLAGTAITIRALSKEPASTLVERWLRGDFTIIPDSNPVIDVWDVFVISALAATAFLLPFEVALVDRQPPMLATVDHIIDAIFTIDIVLTFNIAFQSNDAIEQYERSPIRIAQHYMAVPFSENLTAGWFWPDVVTVIPWDAVTNSQKGEQLKLVRVLRLVRMLRLVRVLKLFKRLHTKVGFSFALVKISRCMIVSLMLVHWLACGWAHLGLHGHEYGGQTSWLTHTELARQKEVADFTCIDAYTLALYVCFVVLTTVGFGDIVPLNHLEVMFMTATIFLTGLTWAWVVANVVEVINHMDVYGGQFNQVMDDLNRLMKDKHVKQDLQVRIRKHLHEAYHVHRHRHHQTVVRWLSDGLQGELAAAAGVDTICSKIWYFRNVPSSGWIIDLAQHFVAELFSPDEHIMHIEAVSVILKGSAVRKGRVLIRDDVIGEDMILMTEILRDTAVARTLSLCEVMTLDRDKLLQACEKHDDLNLRLRRAQIKLALWRAFIYVAKRLNQRHTQRKQTHKSKWDTLLGSEAETDHDKYMPQRLYANDEILKSLKVQKREGWVESGGGQSAMAQLFARKVSSKDAGKSGEILNQLAHLREEVVRQQQQTARRLDAVAQHVDGLDHRTRTLEDQLRQERARAVELAQVQQPTSTKSDRSASRGFFGRR